MISKMPAVQERDGSNNPLVSYTRGDDLSGSMGGAGGIGGLLARSSGYSSGNWTSHADYYSDANGNITALLDASQSLVADYRYDPFGNLISKSGTLADANVYRFSSKEVQTNSGMYYYGRRFYDPNLQRWINRDPIEEQGGINLFSFSANDPVTHFDPFGMDPPKPPAPPGSGKSPFQPGKDNCLSYGLDCPGGAKQPDGGDGRNNGKDCKQLLSQISGNYSAQPVPKGGKCPPGTHKISVFSDGNGGYHIQRQNSDGSWSEMGLNDPNTYPPRTCQRGSSGTDCGNLCAPDQP